MNRRNILIDIDNTLTKIDYTLRTMEDYFKVERKELEDIYTFNLNQVYGVPDELAHNFWKDCEGDIVRNSELNKKVYHHILGKLRPTDYVSIVTARAPEHHKETLKWLDKNDIFYHELHCVGKELSKLEWSKEQGKDFHVVVEDSPSYLELLPDTVRKVVVDYPYNRHIKADVRLRKE